MSAQFPQSSRLRDEGTENTAFAAPRRSKAILRFLITHNVFGRPQNRLIVALAGSRRLRSFAIIYHQGRRSGRAYATPTSARPIASGFIIPLTFGEGSQWYQNVRAAGKFTIRWNGGDYTVVDPVIVEMEAARSAFSRIEQALLPLLGIERFVLVRFAATAEGAPVHDASTTLDEMATGPASSPLPDSRTNHEVAS